MYAVLLAGHKKSGKTQLARMLCRSLRSMGRTVAVAKFSSHPMDKPGSDTNLLSSEANAMAGFDPETTSLIWPGQWSLLDVLPLLQAEVLILEGGKHMHCLPRIVLPRPEDAPSGLSQGLGIAQWGGHPYSGLRQVYQAEEAARLILERGFILPGLDCGECGRRDCSELAREIVAGHGKTSYCTAMGGEDIQIDVNGVQLPLNPFVRQLMQKTLEGMLSALKGAGSGQVQIRMRRK